METTKSSTTLVCTFAENVFTDNLLLTVGDALCSEPPKTSVGVTCRARLVSRAPAPEASSCCWCSNVARLLRSDFPSC